MRKTKIIKSIIIVLFLSFLTVLGYFINKEPETEIIKNKEYNINIIVDVQGQVRNPGIYCLGENDRVSDAIAVAGGLTTKADTEGINLAAKITDGMRVIIPSVDNETLKKISINLSSIDELMTIPEITKTKAQAIIAYRETHNGFTKLEELLNITGISETIYNKIKEYIIL